MVTGVTASGFEYTIDERRVRSWSMVKKIASMQNTNNDMAIYGIAIDLISDLLGEEQEQKLVNHVVQIYGYDDAEIVSKEFFEIIGSVRQDQGLKNSSSSPVAFQPTRMPSSATLQKPTESMIGTPLMTFPTLQSSQQG